MNDTIISKPTVRVWRNRRGRPVAICLCGWTGRTRWRANRAEFDALVHAAKSLHMPANPIDQRKVATR